MLRSKLIGIALLAFASITSAGPLFNELVTGTAEYRGEACPTNAAPTESSVFADNAEADDVVYKGIYKCKTTSEGTYCVRIADGVADSSSAYSPEALGVLSSVTSAASYVAVPAEIYIPDPNVCCHLIGKTPDGTIYFECR